MATSASLPISVAANGAFTAAPAQAAPPRALYPVRVRPSAPALVAPANCRTPEETPPHDRRARVSHESIYTCIYAQPRASSRRSWCPVCAWPTPSAGPAQGARTGGEIQDLLEHPCAPTRNRGPSASRPLGGDLIKGANNASAIGTLVERTTRLVLLVKLCLIPIQRLPRMCCRHSATSSTQ